MAAVRGRGLGSMFMPSGGVAPVVGQPFWQRYFGIPTHPGFKGGWNVLIPPFLILALERLLSLSEV
jgi:hypothetical protein